MDAQKLYDTLLEFVKVIQEAGGKEFIVVVFLFFLDFISVWTVGRSTDQWFE